MLVWPVGKWVVKMSGLNCGDVVRRRGFCEHGNESSGIWKVLVSNGPRSKWLRSHLKWATISVFLTFSISLLSCCAFYNVCSLEEVSCDDESSELSSRGLLVTESVRSTCPTHLVLYLITVIFRGDHGLWSSSWNFLRPLVTSSLLGTNISSPSSWNPYKTAV
jgi:hypothetical protein